MHWTRSSPTFTVEVRCVLLCTYRVLSRRVQSRIVLAISFFVCLWILSSSFRNCNCCVLFTCWLSPCVYVINSLSFSPVDYLHSAMRRACQPNDEDVQWRRSGHAPTWRGNVIYFNFNTVYFFVFYE
jgi:hypothetical protein